jgi:hypothetical protein
MRPSLSRLSRVSTSGKPLTLLEKAKSFLMFQSQQYLRGKLNTRINEAFGEVFSRYDLIKDAGTPNDIDYIKRDRFTENELFRFFYRYFAKQADISYHLEFGYDYDPTVDEVFEGFLKKACEHLQADLGALEKFIEEVVDQFALFAAAFEPLAARAAADLAYTKLFRFLGPNAAAIRSS